MKLLFDQNLSFKLCQALADLFSRSSHRLSVPLLLTSTFSFSAFQCFSVSRLPSTPPAGCRVPNVDNAGAVGILNLMGRPYRPLPLRIPSAGRDKDRATT